MRLSRVAACTRADIRHATMPSMTFRVTLLLLALAGPALAQESCLVVGISDGDTLTARCGEPDAYRQVKVRLAEIDAPEKAQPFGNRSRQHLASLCFQQLGEIRIETTDRYGRAVARVSCRGKDASAEQLRVGMAWWFVRYGKDRELQDLESQARAARVGLWRDAEPVPPWVWRRDRGPPAQQPL